MWKFDQPENCAAITTKYIIENKFPILIVIHYLDDHSWAFLCGTTNDEKDGRVISMKEAILHDKTLENLYDLQPGWKAFRKSKNDKWERIKNE